MRAGPAGPPDDDQIPDTMGRPSRPTAPLIHASVQTVVVSPRVPTVDPVRGGRVLGQVHLLLIFECYRRRRFPQLLGYLPELRGNTFPPRGDSPIVPAAAYVRIGPASKLFVTTCNGDDDEGPGSRRSCEAACLGGTSGPVGTMTQLTEPRR